MLKDSPNFINNGERLKRGHWPRRRFTGMTLSIRGGLLTVAARQQLKEFLVLSWILYI
jgi:hypothetical protein